jgi:hypothetical protein
MQSIPVDKKKGSVERMCWNERINTEVQGDCCASNVFCLVLALGTVVTIEVLVHWSMSVLQCYLSLRAVRVKKRPNYLTKLKNAKKGN